MSKYEKIGVVCDRTEIAQNAATRLRERYGLIEVQPGTRCNKLDAMLVLGGDGYMLHTLHQCMGSGTPTYGMNCGTVGFLMNQYAEDGLLSRLENAGRTCIHPLKMIAQTEEGSTYEALAINEVSLLRKTGQAAHLRISIDGVEHLDELICDGVMVSTPAGSSAYNFSAGGSILPIRSELLALTPISAFRPRRWKGAILPHKVTVQFDILQVEKRPVNAAADFWDIKNVISVCVSEDRNQEINLLFDPGHSLEERILREQFM